MKKQILTLALLAISFMTHAQKDSFLKEYLERFENSKKYLSSVAEAMPEEKYGFKPTQEEMSFARQLMHIASAMDWHAQSLIGGRKAREKSDSTFTTNRSKKQMIEVVGKTFDETSLFIKQFDPEHYEDKVTYNNYFRTKRQELILLADHVTHHRAQMLVYLRLNDIVPPKYVEFQ